MAIPQVTASQNMQDDAHRLEARSMRSKIRRFLADTQRKWAIRQIAHLLQAVLLAFAYAVLSTPAAYTSHPDTLAALIWPAPALAVALLWNLPYRQWWPFLIAVFCSMMVVGDVDELPLDTDAAYALLNVFQVVLYTALGRHFVCASGELNSTRKLARYLVFLPLLATSVVAALGATIGMLTKHTSWFEEWSVILVGNGLAILVLLPALLSWCGPPSQQSQADGKQTIAPIAAALVSLLFLAAGLVHHLPADVFRVVLSLVLVWAAIAGGIRAVSLGLLTAATLGIGLTLAGHGAYDVPAAQNGIRALQVDLASLAILSFFVAVAVQERRKLDIRLERARRFEAMGFLAGGIAHDFNNVLGAVGGYAEMAMLHAGPAAQGSLREVALAVARGKDLTQQILLAGRRGERSRQVVDFRNAITQSAALVRAMLPAGLTMTVTLPCAPVLIRAHEGQLVRALLNLMRNAAQAATSNVAIHLTVGPAGEPAAPRPDHLVGELLETNCAWADVTDDGHGIPEAHLHQLFDPFFSSRLADGSPRESKGTGLGLAIVAGVATDHEGGVALWSGQDAATRFRFMLPLCAIADPLEPYEVAERPGSGQAVLLLEADAAVLERREDWLAELGFEPIGFSCRAALLAALEKAPDQYALLITSLTPRTGLPDTLLLQVQQISPRLPVISGAGELTGPVITKTDGLIGLPADADFASLQIAVTMALNCGIQHLADNPPLQLFSSHEHATFS